MSNFDSRKFRNALGSFATGIAVVTAKCPNGKPMGITINSFASVSLEPPLVLWSIDKNSDLYQQFCSASHYAVHVLPEDAQSISNHFTTADDKQFDNFEITSGVSDLPLLPGCIAIFQCKVTQKIEAGDHTILIGHVLDMQHDPAKPLIFHAGQYTKLV